MTVATAGWWNGNWSAAVARGTPWAVTTRSSARTRSTIAGGAGW